MTTDIGILRRKGFEGFVPVKKLREQYVGDVPTVPGVYVVLREESGPPKFLEVSRGGWFKERNPAVDIDVLVSKWIEGEPLLYIGKADQLTGLRGRIRALVQFGDNEPVSHWGGRYLWQLEESENLLVGWKRTPADVVARLVETEMLEQFMAEHGGRLPFANLRV